MDFGRTQWSTNRTLLLSMPMPNAMVAQHTYPRAAGGLFGVRIVSPLHRPLHSEWPIDAGVRTRRVHAAAVLACVRSRAVRMQRSPICTRQPALAQRHCLVRASRLTLNRSQLVGTS